MSHYEKRIRYIDHEGVPREVSVVTSAEMPTLRDLFAMAALNSIADEPPLTGSSTCDDLGTFIDYERAGRLAYRYADAMLAARGDNQ